MSFLCLTFSLLKNVSLFGISGLLQGMWVYRGRSMQGSLRVCFNAHKFVKILNLSSKLRLYCFAIGKVLI